MFNWLFGKTKKYELVHLKGNDEFNFEIVGESHYQDALELIAGGRDEDGADHEVTVQLIPEPNNAFDENAVMVQIEGKIVGYLSREMAIFFHSEMERLAKKGCGGWCYGEIVGGWEREGSVGYFGLKLDLELPFTIAG